MLFYLGKQGRSTAYIDRSIIKKNVESIDTHKVLIPEAGGSGYDSIVIGKPEYAPPNSVCSQTYLFASFEDKPHAVNFIGYLKTKLFRILVAACKISQHTPSKNYRFVPVQDFSKPWTDAELYAKYGLSSEEVAFVENMIRPMD